MRKIALVMDDEIRSFTLTRVAGVLQKIRESGEDVNLYIFRSSSTSSMDEDYNTGEYNIYHLPDFSAFDGIIVDLNNIRKSETLSSGTQAFEYVIEQIKKSGKPRISIANDIEDFYFVGIDNYASMKNMITHLHQVHQCEKYWFIMGPSGNFENQNRTKAVIDYMDEQGFPHTEDDFYYESFEYQCGLNGFEELLKKHDSLPDAIMCANDNIAIGVCEKAREMGYRIPEDFRVTGFDNYDKAAVYSPRISTVDQMKGKTGYQCTEIMFKLWNNEDVPRINHTQTESIFWDSCGCNYPIPKDPDGYIINEIHRDVENTEYNEQMKALGYELVHCTSVADICRLMTERLSILRDTSLYLVLDKHMNEEVRSSETHEHFFSEQEQFLTTGYPESMTLVFAYERGVIKDMEPIEVKNIFPLFESEKKGTDFTFIPLHFGQYTVGYFVVENGIDLMESRYLIDVINTLSNAIENFYRKDRLKHANEILSRLYIRDSLTGLFNRLGYQKKALALFKTQKEQKENLTVLFIDMDRLKYINDNYGHEYGDFSLKIIASALFHICTENAIPIRWGGDEFLVIMPVLTPAELEDVKERLHKEIAENAKKMQIPCPLTISIGSINTDMNSAKTLDDYIQEADERMYEEKQAKKTLRDH